MKKFLPLLVCLSLSFFTVARATKPNHTPGAAAKTAHKGGGLTPKETAEFEESKAQQKDTDEEVASADDDSVEDTSDDAGEAINGDDGSEAAGDDNTGDDKTADDGGGDHGSDDGGGDEGE
jgi:hypothetical protein